ncbi:MAG: hypothetical protein PWQ82_676 [Thermosediminibacterales bacterium]|nr:hypothetical protein [Thermosediminibacterales bacterium]
MAKIIYHCYGGTHSSIVAAAIHLNLLPEDRIPTGDELLNLPFFDKLNKEDHGKIIYMGTDDFGNRVYSLGRRNAGNIIIRAVKGVIKLFGFDSKSIYFIDTMPTVNFYMCIGGILSRKFGLSSVGRPILIYGIKRAYYNILKLVKTNRFLSETSGD